MCAGPGVDEALRARGVTTVREGRADAVVVGWHTDFDYARLTAAFRAVHAGARLIGTNDDPTYPTPDGLLPGGGSILAAVATAARHRRRRSQASRTRRWPPSSATASRSTAR